MQRFTFQIPGDIPASLKCLLELFIDDAIRLRHVAVDTINMELLYICRFLRFLKVQTSAEEWFRIVTPDLISRFLAQYANGHGNGSVRWMQVSLRSFLRFSYRHSFLAADLSALVPVFKLRRLSRVPRCLPDSCITRLYNDIDTRTACGLRDSAIICLLATYGVRGVQLRRLRLEDVDWRNDRIRFPAVKGGRSVEQPLVADAGNRLADYIRYARPESEFSEVFLTLRAPFRPICTSSSLSSIIHRYIKRFGIILPEGVSHGTHGFRHAFASRMVGKIPFKDLIDQLGHRDPSSTLVYSKIDMDGLHQAALPWPEERS